MSVESKAIIHRAQVTPTISITPAFTAGDAMHTGAVQIPNALQYEGSGQIVGVTISDLDKKTTDLTVVFFNGNPSNSTITANAALDIDDGDLLNCLGHIKIVAADYASFNDNCIATKECLIPIDCGKDNRSDLYMVLMSDDTDDFDTATALTVSIFVEQD